MTREDYQYELIDNPMPCQACEGLDLIFLGVLGQRVYVRCRDCHHEFHLIDHGEVKEKEDMKKHEIELEAMESNGTDGL
jgi:hypothetical protein